MTIPPWLNRQGKDLPGRGKGGLGICYLVPSSFRLIQCSRVLPKNIV